MQIHAELIYEEGLNNLIIEKDAFGQPLLILLMVFLPILVRHAYRKLVLEHSRHLFVVILESAHDIFASKDEVHHTRHQLPLSKLL